MIDYVKASYTVALLFLTIGLFAQNPRVSFPMDDCSFIDEIGTVSDVTLDDNPECICGVNGSAWRLRPGQFLSANDGLSNAFRGDFALSFYFSPRDQSDQLIMLYGSECEGDTSMTISYEGSMNRLNILLRNNNIFFIRELLPLNDRKCWNHVVITRIDNDFFIYLDGRLERTVRGIVVDFDGPDSLRIGGLSCIGLSEMNSAVDELRIYGQGLEAQEVRDLFIETDFLEENRAVVLSGEPYQANVLNSCADNFSWNPAQNVDDPTLGNATFSVTEDSEYVLRMDQDGCSSYDSLSIIIVDSASFNCDELILPTAFTPNGDGLNEDFGILNGFIVDELISFKIIDRWGETIFQSDDPMARWNGSFRGTPVNPGVFHYEVVYRCQGEEKYAIGALKVMR